MTAFLRRHWKVAVPALVALLFLSFLQHLAIKNDEAIADMMARRVGNRLHKSRLAMEAKFAKLHAAKAAALADWARDKDAMVARHRAEVRRLQAAGAAAASIAATLTDCRLTLSRVVEENALQLATGQRLCEARIQGLQEEIQAWKDRDTESAAKIVELTRAGVLAVLRGRRRWAVGPQAGWGSGGGYVGGGITYAVFTF